MRLNKNTLSILESYRIIFINRHQFLRYNFPHCNCAYFKISQNVSRTKTNLEASQASWRFLSVDLDEQEIERAIPPDRRV